MPPRCASLPLLAVAKSATLPLLVVEFTRRSPKIRSAQRVAAEAPIVTPWPRELTARIPAPLVLPASTPEPVLLVPRRPAAPFPRPTTPGLTELFEVTLNRCCPARVRQREQGALPDETEFV